MARSSSIAAVTGDRNKNCSETRTQPASSLAPALNSGTNTWPYLRYG
jgi:hypothetical protein